MRIDTILPTDFPENNSSTSMANDSHNWFLVEGDLDDFIFYGESKTCESER